MLTESRGRKDRPAAVVVSVVFAVASALLLGLVTWRYLEYVGAGLAVLFLALVVGGGVGFVGGGKVGQAVMIVGLVAEAGVCVPLYETPLDLGLLFTGPGFSAIDVFGVVFALVGVVLALLPRPRRFAYRSGNGFPSSVR